MTPSAPVVTPLPANAAPQILNLSIDKTTVHSGDIVSGNVETSPNVTSVEARIGGFVLNVPKVAEGRFRLAYTVPRLPFFLHNTFPMEVIARNSAGVTTTRTIPITIR